MKATEEILIQLENIESKTLQEQRTILLNVSEKLRGFICDKTQPIAERRFANQIHCEIQVAVLNVAKMIEQDEQWFNNEILISNTTLN